MIREGAVVRVPGGNKPGRPGVVLRRIEVQDGVFRLFVPWGTGTDRAQLARVVVEPRTSEGIALDIYKTTYFYRGNVTVCAERSVEMLRSPCPPGLFLRLKALYGL